MYALCPRTSLVFNCAGGLFTLGVAIFGVLAVARWAFHQLKTNADFGSQSESASLLLQEYEQRGVGWLWQVDAENRVTYISSRMTALLGRPASQLLGHSMPSLLGGHADEHADEEQGIEAAARRGLAGRGARLRHPGRQRQRAVLLRRLRPLGMRPNPHYYQRPGDARGPD